MKKPLNSISTGIDPVKAQVLLQKEQIAFVARNPRSQALSQRANAHLLFGVPLHWMNDWGTPFALQVAQAQGAQLVDVDGHALADFCLGDTGAMFGHSPAPVAQAVAAQVQRGITAMLASEDAAAVGELLAERFGLPFWQFAMTATDANRFVLRWLRADPPTGEPRRRVDRMRAAMRLRTKALVASTDAAAIETPGLRRTMTFAQSQLYFQ